VTWVVGLTGGIGSGKSTVAAEFATLGVDVIDADEVSHRLTRKGAEGWAALRANFSPRFFAADGELDRAALRAAVFSDPALKARLEATLHPLIGAAIAGQRNAWKGPYGILMIPLLLESGRYRDRIDRLLVVDCTQEEQIRRVQARSGLSADEVRAIMATQATRAERLSAADDVIDNSGGPEALGPQIRRLDALYRGLSQSGVPARNNG
jgi:dephospho-CoA kinase